MRRPRFWEGSLQKSRRFCKVGAFWLHNSAMPIGTGNVQREDMHCLIGFDYIHAHSLKAAVYELSRRIAAPP